LRCDNGEKDANQDKHDPGTKVPLVANFQSFAPFIYQVAYIIFNVVRL
jgi:hypothetical protein